MTATCARRCLAGFEQDAHRACVMHRSRAKALEPLCGQLNAQHFLGLVRSISLELGHVYRRLAEIREVSGREGGKVGWVLGRPGCARVALVARVCTGAEASGHVMFMHGCRTHCM
jgi:hypothetical protein